MLYVILCNYIVHLSLSSRESSIAPFQWLSPQELAEERAKTTALRLALQQRGLVTIGLRGTPNG